MALPWLAALRVIPWRAILENAPAIARSADALLSRTATPRLHGDSSHEAYRLLADRVAALEQRDRETAELLTRVTDQLADITAAMELVRFVPETDLPTKKPMEQPVMLSLRVAMKDSAFQTAPTPTPNPRPIKARPMRLAARWPLGSTFSTNTTAVRRSIQARLITPAATSTANRAQQQPKQ